MSYESKVEDCDKYGEADKRSLQASPTEINKKSPKHLEVSNQKKKNPFQRGQGPILTRQ